ncbi:hypothetical protein [uncultured Stenotrophomonas sp.]|uniref:hypothetical protein n=1 Tax=uncultured Stenotrophomonas sp. TaxID=165438 RepID=UPI0025F4EEAF|nr:hypothetical protein [uncultured Stenotrophomonas sp.]
MTSQYTPDSKGMADFLKSDVVGNAMRDVADDIASQANAQGAGVYDAIPRTVTGGWRNTERAGAEVVEEQRDMSDVRARTLVNLSQQYRMRGGG